MWKSEMMTMMRKNRQFAEQLFLVSTKMGSYSEILLRLLKKR